ncbi:MAG: hypothetical protein EOP83_23895 [Verrucomicrobiaceae bacterium]|nr:MAG: hypothetical protein EOP83_23895 [Verrucomicrobiaceae bacterium]
MSGDHEPSYLEVLSAVDEEFAAACSAFENSGGMSDPARSEPYIAILDRYFGGTLDPNEEGVLSAHEAAEMIRAL